MTIHWVHAGPDALFGLKRIVKKHRHNLCIWTDSSHLLAEIDPTFQQPYNFEAFMNALRIGDVIVAPRLTDLTLVRLAMACGAHLVASWRASSEMHKITIDAENKGSAILTEIGIVPGIDHMMARDLVNEYHQSAKHGDILHFTCYGGEMPKYPDNFRHKFNTSPLPLLSALATPTSWIENGETQNAAFPFNQIRPYDLNLPTPERHQVYPHYDSAPYLPIYGFDPSWKVATAQRGAIRLKGWDDGWAEVFSYIQKTGKNSDSLRALAKTLELKHPYAQGEADRVVLSVALKVEQEGKIVWHREWVMDASGGRSGFARSRLNSLMLELAVQALHTGQIKPGLHIGTTNHELIANWLVEVAHEAEFCRKINHLYS